MSHSSTSRKDRHSSKRHLHESPDENRDDSHKKHKQISDSLAATIKPIDEDDYYEKSTEFRLWLRESKHIYFDELEAKEARRYFKKFVKKWNQHELKEKYYQGFNSSAQLEASESTRYKWAFANKLNKFELDTVRDSVDSMTSKGAASPSGTLQSQQKATGSSSSSIKRRAAPLGPALPDTFDKEEQYESERYNRKYEARKEKERREAILDEVAPRETGREAALAKKRALNAYHKRERSPDVELSEADLMGGDDFQARLMAERRAKERREARQAERREQRLAPIKSKMEEYKAKEDATMAMFRKMAEEQKKRGAY